MKDVITLKEEPQGYSDSDDKRKYEFKVFLSSLVGGDGGSQKLCARLFFKYEDNERFSYFLRCLQDETQLSTIPPIGIPESPLSPNFPSKNTERTDEVPGFEEWQFSSTSPSTMDSFASSCTFSDSQSLFQPQTPILPPRRRRRSIRGYTLEDGPWLYQVAKIGVSNTPEVYHELRDLMSYVKMVKTVQEENLSEADKPETAVIIMHVGVPFLDGLRESFTDLPSPWIEQQSLIIRRC